MSEAKTGVMLESKNLHLIPHVPADLLALMKGREHYLESSGLTAADGLREFYVSDDIPSEFVSLLEAARGADPWVFGFAVVEGARRLVVGSAGFKGEPDEDGTVEIAYGIVPLFEGRGYATEAAAALVAFAFADPRVTKIRAHTMPTQNASARVLEKLGFRRAGEVADPEDGPVWRWEQTGKDR